MEPPNMGRSADCSALWTACARGGQSGDLPCGCRGRSVYRGIQYLDAPSGNQRWNTLVSPEAQTPFTLESPGRNKGQLQPGRQGDGNRKTTDDSAGDGKNRHADNSRCNCE